MGNEVNSIEKKENIFTGIIGALLFSLLGGALWVEIYLFAGFAWASGIIIAILAVNGYRILGKGKSITGVVISLFIALAVIVFTSYVCLSVDIFCAYIEWFATGVKDHSVTMIQAFFEAYTFLEDPGILEVFIEITGLGMVSCVLGFVFYFVGAVRYRRQNKKAQIPEENNGQN